MRHVIYHEDKAVENLKEKLLLVFGVDNPLFYRRVCQELNAEQVLESLGFPVKELVNKEHFINQITVLLDKYTERCEFNPGCWYLPEESGRWQKYLASHHSKEFSYHYDAANTNNLQ